MIIGWALLNTKVQTSLHLALKNKITTFEKEGILGKDSRIAFGQMLLENFYRGTSIAEKMLSLRDALVCNKYDLYMATVRKGNKPSEMFFRKNAFKLFYEDDDRFYFLKPIAKTKHDMVKKFSIEIQGNVVEVNIRPGQIGDECELHELNKKWLRDARGNDLSKGFLTSLYSPEDFRMIIDAKEIVVAEIAQTDRLVGWCLTNNIIENEVRTFSKNKIESLKENGTIEPSHSVALGLQWLIHSEYQRKGIIEHLFKQLKEIIRDKYDVIEASVRKQNIAGEKATAKLGMLTVDEDDIRRYKIIFT